MPDSAAGSSFYASSSSSLNRNNPAFSQALVASWGKLLTQLKVEIESIGRLEGQDSIPEINFHEFTSNAQAAGNFSAQVKRRGVAVIRGVISEETIHSWMGETEQYLCHNNATFGHSSENRPCDYGGEVWWSPVQVKARAHPSLLETQRLLMGLWHASSPETTPLTTNFPVTSAEPLFVAGPGETLNNTRPAFGWEGRDSSPAVQNLFRSDKGDDWGHPDPWNSSSLLEREGGLHSQVPIQSPLTMFNGLLSLNQWSSEHIPLQFLPMLRLSDAYLQLRHFFRPKHHPPTSPGYLQPDNWFLQTQSSGNTPGMRAGHATELQQCLLLSGGTVTAPPALRPGDFLIWHRDIVHTTVPTAERVVAVHIPICPLTHKTAIYLAHQRKSFLLGHYTRSLGGKDEAGFMGRPGVQEVSDVGGNEGLRAMGLLPWDEDDVETEVEADVLEMVNNVLFPDRYDFDIDR